MEKKYWVRDFPSLLGQEIRDVFLVERVVDSENEATKWKSFELRDKTGKCYGKVWAECIGPDLEGIAGKLVRITGKVELFRGRFELRIVKAEPVQEPFQASDFVDSLEDKARDSYVQELLAAIENVKDISYRNLLQLVFTPSKIEQYSCFPASRQYYFNYIGGWLAHKYIVLRYCQMAAKFDHLCPYDHVPVNQDLLVTAALLCDTGVIAQYRFDGLHTTENARGRLVGSICDTLVYVASLNCRIPKEQRVNDLTELFHILRTCDGVEPPATKEAVILSGARTFAERNEAHNACFRHCDLDLLEGSRDTVYSSYFENRIERLKRG